MSKVALDCDSTTLLLSVCEGNASLNEIDPDMYPTTCLLFLSYEDISLKRNKPTILLPLISIRFLLILPFYNFYIRPNDNAELKHSSPVCSACCLSLDWTTVAQLGVFLSLTAD